ncbi:sorbitol dehydrogenase [Podospora australis]|uniref:Sorbitol dehydrogenase n=1 Tax=Podospora australis TaxID=1536484 RepID=A0AAN6WX87_9PEZI|nr:sorbitol dehydrogenase [Podospora australis]
MSTSVKASVLYGARDLQVTERTLPELRPQDVRVAVKSTGLCGSDLHYFNHFRNGDILVREPITLGHESAGVVTAVGSGVTSLQPGDRVALEVGQPCEQCELCDAGRYNICKEMKFRSSAKAFPHAQGTLQEEIIHPSKYCHKAECPILTCRNGLPQNVSLEQGALVEPLSVALHALDRARLAKGSAVLVFGAGTVGLLVAAITKAVTKSRVVIADIQEERLRFAVKNHFADAYTVVPPKRPATLEEKLAFAKEVADAVQEQEWQERTESPKEADWHDGSQVGEVDATFECAGVESCLQAAIYATAPGGKIMLIGMGNPIQTLPISAAALREVDLIGVFRYANTYGRVIDLLANHADDFPDLSLLVTHRFQGMENIPKAFDMAAKVNDEEGKLVIKVNVTM